MTRKLVAVAMLAAGVAAHAGVPCLPEGRTVAMSDSTHTELVFIHAQPDGDITFALPDKDYVRNPDAEPGHIEFSLEDVPFRFHTAAIADFASPQQAKDAEQVLTMYAASIQSLAKESQHGFQTLQVLDRVVRPAYRSTPPTHIIWFRLATAEPKDVSGVYYIAAAMGSSLYMVAAAVLKPEQLGPAQAALDRIGTSLRLLEEDDLCPAKAFPEEVH
ncbi:hypothetical protein ACFJGW_06080 [Burkholderiaceae bacterium UC74_6]